MRWRGGPDGLVRRLATNEDGVTAVVGALCLTSVMGFAGLAVDVGLWYNDKRTAQGAADSAAYSAAIDLAASDTDTGVVASGKAIAAQYGFTDGSGGVTVTVDVPPTSGPNKATSGAVEVIVTKTESLFFSSFFLQSAKIAARAVAVAGSSGSKYCVESLDSSSSKTTVNLNNGATLDVSQCGVQVNGAGSAALFVTGGAVLKAIDVSVVGHDVTNNGGSITATKITTSAPAAADPYAGVAVPTPGACTGPPSYASYDQSNNYTGHYVISPGTYCSGFSVFNGVTVTMNPGVYIVKGGLFSLQGGTTVTGTGVTIVLTGSGSNYATANIANGVTLNLTAPTSGATSGIAIFQNRLARTSGVNSVAGGASLNITGALYFPHQTVDFSNGSSNASACTQLIAYDLNFTGGARFGANCAGTGVIGIGAAGATTLVE